MMFSHRKSLPGPSCKATQSACGLGRRLSHKVISGYHQFSKKADSDAFKYMLGNPEAIIARLDKMFLSTYAPLLSQLRVQPDVFGAIHGVSQSNNALKKVIELQGQVVQLDIAGTNYEGIIARELPNLEIVEASLEEILPLEAKLYPILNILREGCIKGEIKYIQYEISLLKEEELKWVLEQEWGDGSRLLHLAIDNHHIELAKLLVEKGASPNARDYNERTALHLAYKYGAQELISFLQNHGADIKAKDLLGRTMLHYAAINGHCHIARELLDGDKSLLNAKSMEGNTPLYDACLNGQAGMVRLLLGFGAKKWIKNHLDQTALDCAWKFYQPEGFYSQKKLEIALEKLEKDKLIFAEIIDVLAGREIPESANVEVSGAEMILPDLLYL